jgi:steroid delta-isomerase
MSEDHPAMLAAHNSWRCVHGRLRDEWLALMADDVLIEDPIGVGPSNPTGEGFRGHAGAEKFWDRQLAATESVTVEAHESFAAGNESAHLLTLTSKFPGGTTIIVHGIFSYVVNEAGLLTAMRGWWSMDQAQVLKD